MKPLPTLIQKLKNSFKIAYDQIIVLNHGEVIEKGTHQSLLKQKGYYHKLYLLQFNND